MIKEISNAKSEVSKRKSAKQDLPEDGYLLSGGCYKVTKIRREYYLPDGTRYMAIDFDIQTNNRLRQENFYQGILGFARNFDPKNGNETSREDYAKDGSLTKIYSLMKNGDVRKVEIYKNGRRTEVHGRASARRLGLISYSGIVSLS